MNMKAFIFLALIIVTSVMPFTLHADEQFFDHSHQAWDQVLKEHVIAKGPISQVKYGQLKANSAQLDGYLKTLEQVSDAQYQKFTEQQKLAFLINAYNAFTLKLIINHYPVASIKDIGSIFKSAWKQKFFTLFGTTRYLDYIEHERIRQDFDEPRIHFALVCAAKGCPALRNEAYVADRVTEQVEDAGKLFLSDRSRNRYDAKTGKLSISRIFKWYGADFNNKYGSFQKYIATRITDNPEQSKRIAVGVPISYLDYDWALNDASSQ